MVEFGIALTTYVMSSWQIDMRILMIQRKRRVLELRHPLPSP